MKSKADMIVSGYVQGVGFRYAAKDAARQCSLKGEVKNLDDDTVRITCEGEENDIHKFIEMIHRFSMPIDVDDIQTKYSEPSNQYERFKIVLGDQLTEMVEGFSTGSIYMRMMLGKQDQMLGKQDQMLDKQDQMLGKQDQMLDKQDQMLDKQDQMLGKQDQMLHKQDQMLDKQDVVISEVRTLSSSMHRMMDKRFQRLEN